MCMRQVLTLGGQIQIFFTELLSVTAHPWGQSEHHKNEHVLNLYCPEAYGTFV